MIDIVDILKAHIPIGKENAIHLKELSNNIGLSETKTKNAIRETRQKGLLDICSGVEGYWIPENDSEREKFEHSLRKHAITCLKTTKPIRHSLREYKGQISLAETLQDVSEEVQEYVKK